MGRTKIFISIVFVVLTIIGFHYIGWLRPVETFLSNIIYPGVAFFYQRIEGNETVEDTILTRNTVDQAEMQRLRQENEQLRSQLHFITSTPYTSIGADVIGKNVDPVTNSLIINRGTHDGIDIDDPVIAHNGILVGKVSEVHTKSAMVRLIIDNQSKIAATILNKDISLGLVEGGYGLSIRMNLIPQNERVDVGDAVVTSGLEPSIPRGLFIGTVEAVEKQAFEPFQQALISSPTALDKIRLVSVLVSHTE